MTELTLDQAIEALNKGDKVTHPKYENRYFTKTTSEDVMHVIDCGVDHRIPYGDVYYRETLTVAVYNLQDEYIGDWLMYLWINDETRRNFPLEGWRII